MRRDRGSASLELVGMLPVIGLLLLAVLQAAAAAYALQGTTDAVRQAARAQSLGQDARAAAERALPGGLSVKSLVPVAGDGVRLSVAVPRIVPIPLPDIRRTAVLPGGTP